MEVSVSYSLIAVIHVGNEVSDVFSFVFLDRREVFIKIGHLPASDDIDDLAGFKIIQDTAVFVGGIFFKADLINAQDIGKLPSWDKGDLFIEDLDDPGVSQTIAFCDLGEGQLLAEVIDDHPSGLIGDPGISLYPSDIRREGL